MASFSEANFSKKLTELNNSQQSIQTLSLWLIHHRKHSKTIVEVWGKELGKARPNRRLTFLYLANDVVQNSKKKGPEFSRDFKLVLPEAYKNTAREADEKTRGSMGRMLKIWGERNVFDSEFLQKLKDTLEMKNESDVEPPQKKHKPKKMKDDVEPPKKKHKPKSEPAKKKPKKRELSLMEEVEQDFSKSDDTEPPEAKDLVDAMLELENAASSDAAVRERIAALPPEVSDVSLLDKLKDKGDADKLSGQVEDACLLLAEYNGRLTSELDERKRVARMLRAYISSQKEALTQSEAKLKEYQNKLDKVSGVRKELKSHIQSLPDLTLLPDVTGGLAPLPSAGDLFAIEKE